MSPVVVGALPCPYGAHIEKFLICKILHKRTFFVIFSSMRTQNISITTSFRHQTVGFYSKSLLFNWKMAVFSKRGAFIPLFRRSRLWEKLTPLDKFLDRSLPPRQGLWRREIEPPKKYFRGKLRQKCFWRLSIAVPSQVVGFPKIEPFTTCGHIGLETANLRL